MRLFERYFHSPISPARAFLVSRSLLALLAFDVWFLRIPVGGRHAVDDFNVAHFAWLDRVQPLPTAETYVALLLIVGLVSLVLFFADLDRRTTALLFFLYSYSWAMTRLDSYQHHYYLSLALCCLIFFPLVGASELASHRDLARARVEGFGFALLSATTAIVYASSAVTKLDPLWLSGDALQRIPGFRAAAEIGRPTLESVGLTVDGAAAALAIGAIVLEVIVALGYLVAPLVHDDPQHRLYRWPRISFVAAVALHLGIEAMDLKIGWFSYYMLALASGYLLPISSVAPAARLAARAIEGLHRLPTFGRSLSAPARGTASALSASILLVLLGQVLELPGATVATGLAAAGLLLAILATIQHERVTRLGVATFVAGFALWLTCTLTELPSRYHLGAAIHQMAVGRIGEARTALARSEQLSSARSTLRPMIREMQSSLDRSAR